MKKLLTIVLAIALALTMSCAFAEGYSGEFTRGNAALMSHPNNFPHRIHCSQHIAHMSNADNLCAFVEHLGQSIKV